MKTKPELRIRCTSSATLPLADMKPLQGNLKILSDENYAKLKGSLLKHGITFPIFIWKQGKKNWILDGTQRDRVLTRMQQEGFVIPPLPVDYIEAGSEQEAREKILLISSQYGEMTDDTFAEFLKESELKIEDLAPTLRLPEIDIEALLQTQAETDSPAGRGVKPWECVVRCGSKKEASDLAGKLRKQGFQCRVKRL